MFHKTIVGKMLCPCGTVNPKGSSGELRMTKLEFTNQKTNVKRTNELGVPAFVNSSFVRHSLASGPSKSRGSPGGKSAM